MRIGAFAQGERARACERRYHHVEKGRKAVKIVELQTVVGNALETPAIQVSRQICLIPSAGVAIRKARSTNYIQSRETEWGHLKQQTTNSKSIPYSSSLWLCMGRGTRVMWNCNDIFHCSILTSAHRAGCPST